jgi:hypothetical protein
VEARPEVDGKSFRFRRSLTLPAVAEVQDVQKEDTRELEKLHPARRVYEKVHRQGTKRANVRSENGEWRIDDSAEKKAISPSSILNPRLVQLLHPQSSILASKKVAPFLSRRPVASEPGGDGSQGIGGCILAVKFPA